MLRVRSRGRWSARSTTWSVGCQLSGSSSSCSSIPACPWCGCCAPYTTRMGWRLRCKTQWPRPTSTCCGMRSRCDDAAAARGVLVVDRPVWPVRAAGGERATGVAGGGPRGGGAGWWAANGLRVWQQLAGEGVELVIEDDGSDPARLADRFLSVASRCDLLLGPYSTQLTRAAAETMAGLESMLWNQGGAGDDVQALCPGRMVSVLAPTSRYALPFVRTRA